MEFDVIIIGAGVTGSAAAMELARTDLRVAVLEKASDVCEGTSKANSGICHAGFDAMPGTLKARLNVEGAALMPELAKRLHFAYENNGSLVLCFEEAGRAQIEQLKARGEANGVAGLQILEREELKRREPNISDQAICALYAPSAGIVDPFGLNIAMAENAADNGVQFFFDTQVKTITKKNGQYEINETFTAPVVINAAGTHAADIHNLVWKDGMMLTPRKGEYFLLDHEAEGLCSHTLFQLPTSLGKGVLVTPTVHGNILVGPTAQNMEDPDGTETTSAGLAQVKEKALLSIPDIPWHKTITSFAGVRAVPEGGDFLIQEKDGFIDAAGMESPGLTCAPATGKLLAEMVKEKLNTKNKENHINERKAFTRPDNENWNHLVQENPAYGQVICRCETITKGEILDACSRSIPAKTVDGVKRRVRAGMGRCQGGFCLPKVMEIIAQAHGIPLEEVKKSSGNSTFLRGKIKEDLA